jgi:5-methylcytosine-specific restriction endonuclease McrA
MAGVSGVYAGYRYSQAYRDYMASQAWAARRAAALELAGHKCERCGAADRLTVHHRTYCRLGREAPADLQVLCPSCHEQADAERRARIADWRRRRGR